MGLLSDEQWLHPAGIRLVLVQRSCGYALRPTLSIPEIAKVVDTVRRCGPPGCVVAVDNCYGEMTDSLEPCAVSQHANGLICSSLCMAAVRALLQGQQLLQSGSSQASCNLKVESRLYSMAMESAFEIVLSQAFLLTLRHMVASTWPGLWTEADLVFISLIKHSFSRRPLTVAMCPCRFLCCLL